MRSIGKEPSASLATPRLIPPGWSGTFPMTGSKGKVTRMKFLTTLERDKDGVWVAECPSIPRLRQPRTKPR
jgi:hypothetical protein